VLVWLRHLGTFVVVNVFLVAIWLFTTGSFGDLRTVAADPTQATAPGVGFWPIWPILGWGLFAALHLVSLIGGPKRRQRENRRRGDRDPPVAPPSSEVQAPPASTLTPLFESIADQASRADIGGAEQLIHSATQAEPTQDSAPRSRVVTVVFTDIVGSTSLNETLGDEAYARMLREHRTVVREVLARSPGTEVNTQGDSFLMQFDTAFDAVRTACAIDHALAGNRSAGQFVPYLRIGVHAGDAIEEGADLVGTVLNVASRICGAADADEIFISEAVAEKVAGRVSLVDRGLVRLKGVGQPRHLFAIDWNDSIDEHVVDLRGEVT
jgi:class 3 adenylate cyclase